MGKRKRKKESWKEREREKNSQVKLLNSTYIFNKDGHMETYINYRVAVLLTREGYSKFVTLLKLDI